MGHLPHLITDLALILGAAAVSTLIFRWLKQPLVLGYIIAGFLVSPYFKLTPTVVDKENVETLAEMGVIFLLFSLGLEFSFKKLIRVGGAASITALVEIVFITVSGFYLGRLMNWSTMDSLFLGGMLASSSTTIILRAFDELRIKTKTFAGIVFGVLIVEDIVVILLMVLLSTVAVTREFEGANMLFTVIKLLFFMLLWFAGGIFLLPTFLRKAGKIITDEIMLVLSLALCLGMVVLATRVGFSAELGAFVMGSIIAETTSAEKIEHLLNPVKDLFGAIFFTSVGMMIDPSGMTAYAQPILWVTLLTLFGKLISTTVGALLSGQPLKQSVQVGMSMAQIGEFAFIVATLGMSLGVTSSFLFPVAVGASAITTFTTPYLIKFSGALYHWLERILPASVINRINKYSSETKKKSPTSKWKVNFIRFAIITLFVGFLLQQFFNIYTGFIFVCIVLLLLAVFPKRIRVFYKTLKRRFLFNLNEREIEKSRLNRTELAPWDAHIVPVIVPATAACVGKTLRELAWREITGVNVVMIKRGHHAIAAPGRNQMIFPNDELLVLGTDHQVQRLKVLIRPDKEASPEEVDNVALYNYFISETSALRDKTIRQSGLREKANALVVGIERNGERLLNPESDTVLQSNDSLFIVGDPKKIKAVIRE